ncbi:MAG: ATP synthase F0 subunit A [Flavobacteriales bacterium]|nr:ATP synthase F0 subunit A [Flavobacteriales bacterium]|tara:strand:- start:453 stop:1511 length:1059 start_codon:yes stop_codon:yes gene_type:complete
MMLRLVFGLFLCSSISYSSPEFGDPSNESYGNKKFEPGKMIMHHILDSHEWHVFDWRGKAFSIPLPIIIYHETRGLSAFMSSRFNHGYDAYKGYMMDHGNIICVNEAGELDQNETSKIWDFSITKNVFSLFFSIIVLLSIFLTISKKYNIQANRAPSGLQSFLEPIIIFIRDDIAKSAIGEKDYQRYLPFLLTVFFFIFFNNLLGLVPLFPGGANLTGNIAVPMVMSAMVFIITTLSGKKYYWKHIFAMPGVPKPVLLILTPIEIFGVLLKPLVLMIRLFANITAGHIIILSFLSMIFIFGEMHPAAGYGVSVFSGMFVLFMLTLELLVAFLQAYVFTLLAAMYFGSAVEEH